MARRDTCEKVTQRVIFSLVCGLWVWVGGEIDRTEYERRKLQIDSQAHEAQGKLRHAPTDVKDIEDLLPQVDKIAEVIRAGSAQDKKRLFNTLFERIETRDGELTKLVPRS